MLCFYLYFTTLQNWLDDCFYTRQWRVLHNGKKKMVGKFKDLSWLSSCTLKVNRNATFVMYVSSQRDQSQGDKSFLAIWIYIYCVSSFAIIQGKTLLLGLTCSVRVLQLEALSEDISVFWACRNANGNLSLAFYLGQGSTRRHPTSDRCLSFPISGLT